MKNWKKIVLAAAAPLMLFSFSGCDIVQVINELDETGTSTADISYVVSINQVVRYKRAEMTEIDISTFSGTQICVNSMPLLSQNNIERIEKIKRRKDEYYDLRLHLTKRGNHLWSSLSIQFRKQKVAFIIDGICFRVFEPQLLAVPEEGKSEDENTSVIVEGPFDEYTATMLERKSKENYNALKEKK